MKRNLFAFLVFIFHISYFTFLFAQSKKDLESKKEQLHKDIEFTNKLLEETKKIKSASLNHVVMLNKKISIREELIRTINGEIDILQGQIDETNAVIASLEKDIKKLKEEYAKMIY